MKQIVLMIPAALALVAVPAAASTAPAQPPAVSTPAPAADLEAARAAIQSLDINRVMHERDYAVQIMGHLDRLAAAAVGNPGAIAAIDSLKLFVLPTLDRKDEARTIIDNVLGQRDREVDSYASPLYAALAIEDDARSVATVETASLNVPGVARAELRRLLDRQTMGSLLFGLQTRHQPALRVRLATALFRIGWPGPGELESSDYLRTILIDDSIGRGNAAEAAGIAEGISTPDSIVSMMVRRRYDQVLAPGRDRLELLRSALETRDRTSQDALAGASPAPRRVLERVQYLRGLGRNADAFALVEPFTRDVAATASASEEGMWLINEGAYALIALGRNDEAVRLMRSLAALPVAQNSGLIGPDINFSEILWETGHPQEAIDHAARLERESGQFANDYGKLWLASATACALGSLNRTAEAAPQLERLRGGRDVNPAAATRAFLCLGDDEAAAALMIHRLEGDDPGDAILALQDYSLSAGPAQTGALYDRLVRLRDRPDVRAALDRVGRVYTLPLARTYWGGF